MTTHFYIWVNVLDDNVPNVFLYSLRLSRLSKILSTEANQRLVVGDSFRVSRESTEGHSSKEENSSNSAPSVMRPSLRLKLIHLFWNTVIQFAADSMRSIQALLRLGRALWPHFASQLQSNQVRSTMESIAKRLVLPTEGKVSLNGEQYDKLEEEFVRTLGTKFYSHSSAWFKNNDCILYPLDEKGDIPPDISFEKNDSIRSHLFLRSCLLLASFICQHNKANSDQKVFGSRGGGQRRKSGAMNDIYGGNDEDLAYGSLAKTRPFALERVFSIFVTLVHLNPTTTEDETEILMDSLGSTRLYTDLSHLIDLGHLRISNYNGLFKGEQINLATARFTCTLSYDEAMRMAERLGIPLESYLL